MHSLISALALKIYAARFKMRKLRLQRVRGWTKWSTPTWRKGMTFALLAVVVSLGLWLPLTSQASPRSVSLTRDDFLNGTSNYGDIRISDDALSIQLQNGLAGTWDQATTTGLQLIPSLVDGITNIVSGPNKTLYLMTAFNRQCHFSRYDIERQQWAPLSTPPIACGAGNTLTYDGSGAMYYAPGGPTSDASNRFFRYDIAADSWASLANFPSSISNFSSSVFVSQGSNKYVYLFRGLSSPSFWRYVVSTNTWENLPSFPTGGSVYDGVNLTWDGANSLYGLTNRTGEFKRFDLITQTWIGLPTAPSWGNMRGTTTFANGKVFAMAQNIYSERMVLMEYNVATQSWQQSADVEAGANNYDYPPPLAYDGSRYMYTLIGPEIRPELFRYDTTTDSWNSAALYSQTDDNTMYHQALVYDGSQTAYYIGGTYSSNVDRVFKYDLTTGANSRIGSQFSTNSGNNGVFSGGLIYFMPSSGTLFQSYNPSTDDFVQLADMPYSRSNGADIIDGGDGFLYATFGGRSNFARYNISTNSWSMLTSMSRIISSGGNIVRVDRSIYVLNGGQSGFFTKYDMDTGTWSNLDNLPSGGVDYGAFLTGDTSRYLFANMSSRTDSTVRKMYRYDTTTDSWDRISDLPAGAKPYASAFYSVTNGALYVAQGNTSSLLWKWNPGSSSFASSGEWFSKTYDLQQVETWQSLSSNVTGTGSADFYTRTSPNGVIWTDWEETSGTSINSPADRYLQIKVVLSGDGSTTPVVSDIKLDYTQEETAPTVPSQLTAFGKKDGEVLSSGQTYEYQHPYFTWSGASDGGNGSGVEGYYVYFGLDSNADPSVTGSYQNNTDYTVSTPMTAGEVYYLRIRSKDRIGNLSPSATYFSYRYFYISPPNSIVKTSDSDFTAGSNTNVAVGGGAMQLKKNDTGAWTTGSMAMPEETTSGAAMSVVGDSIYVARGSGTTTFWRYDIPTQSWSALSPVPENVNLGSSMTYNDDTGELYLIVGNDSTGFYKYDIVNDIWESVGVELPSIAQDGSDLTYIGEDKFALLMTGVREFYMYDSAGRAYTPLQSSPTTTSTSGSGIWFDGDDTIYAYFGGWNWYSERNSRVVMAKYSIANDLWRPLATPSVTAMYTENNLVSDGQGNLYIFASNRSDNLNARQRVMKYIIETDTWYEVPGLYAQPLEGSAASDGKRYLYLLPDGSGSDSRKLIRYDTWNNIFSPDIKSIDVLDRIAYDSPTNAWPWMAGNASASAYDGRKYIYALGGDESTSSWAEFVKFDPKTGETKYLPPPTTTGLGGSLGYIDETLYYMPSRNTRNFFKFDESNQQWIRMADLPGNSYRPGTSALIAVNDTFYVIAGNNSNFYHYTPGSGGGTWATLASSPARTLNGSAAYDPGTNSIYIIAGDYSSRFYRYSIATDVWTTMSSLPTGSSYGSAITISDGKAYVFLGGYSKKAYVYDIGSNSWTNGSDSPEPFRYGATMLKIDDRHALAIAGDNSPDIWQFNYPSETTAYSGLAVHESEPLSVAGLYDYAGISVQADIPAGSRVEMWTRTSEDSTNWNEWSIAKEVKRTQSGLNGIVTSIPHQYTQIRIILESDTNMYTPTVSGYTLSYYFDVDPPENPSTIEVFSDASKSSEILNNTWYNHARPVFDWPDPGQPGGATDGPLGSNIEGYWIYVGTDVTASPRTQGVFVPSTEYQPNLTISGTYFVRMQAQDITGNIDGDIYAPFIYKFDNQPPTNPALITVTPSGFTTNNNFSYTWPNAFDANSGVAGYCYHTGATSGPFAIETCQPGTTLENISAAYRSGTNVFYLRSYDIAGNYSSSYTTVSYYYTTDPPGPVTNLRAIPPTSTENLFAFTWDLPALYSGDPDQMSYCYSINILPSPTNTTCTGDRFISAFKAATQEGTNIIYVVARDEANNASWSSFASANFIANTISPGIPLNLVATDTSDRATDRWSITLTWDRPTFEGNGIKDYVVERSEDGHTFDALGNTSNRAFVDLDVTPDIIYQYRVRAQDDVNNVGGASGVVSKSAQGNFASPPNIIVPPVATPSFDQARITWATDRLSSSFVYYGASPGDLSQSKGSLEPLTSHAQTITGLRPSTTYYYRVQSFDDNRNYNLADAYSEIFSFRTTAAAQINGVEVSDVTSNSAVVSWETSVPTKARISYGPTRGYGLSTDDGLSGYTMKHTAKLTDLASGTVHHFRIGLITEFGSSLESDDYTFQTIARPVISNIQFQPVTDEPSASVIVTWTTNVPTSSTVKYSALGETLEESVSALTMDHTVKLRNLASNSDYQIGLSGRDQYGNLAMSTIQNWKSHVDTRPPKISDMSYSVSITDTGETKKAQLIVSWSTDEPATSQVRYGGVEGQTLDNATPLDADPATNHVVVISNLDLVYIYSVQIVSRDLDGNTEYGPRTTVVTPDQELSVFDSILTLIERLFRF